MIVNIAACRGVADASTAAAIAAMRTAGAETVASCADLIAV